VYAQMTPPFGGGLTIDGPVVSAAHDYIVALPVPICQAKSERIFTVNTVNIWAIMTNLVSE